MFLRPPVGGPTVPGPTPLRPLLPPRLDPEAASREAVLAAWRVQLGPRVPQAYMGVREVMAQFRDVLAANFGYGGVHVWLGGSAASWRLNEAWQRRRPHDLDLLVFVKGGAYDQVAQLRTNSVAALRGICGDKARIKDYIFGNPQGHASGVLLRLGSYETCVDLRIVFDDGRCSAYDFRCNGLVCDFFDSDAWSVLPGLDLQTVIDEVTFGVYNPDHALLRDSIVRVWKMRQRGFVPGDLAADDALVGALVQHLHTDEYADRGFGLAFAEMLSRAAPIQGTADAERLATAASFAANAILHLRQAPAQPQSATMLQQLRRLLHGLVPRLALDAHDTHILSALQDDACTWALMQWLSCLAQDDSGPMDGAPRPGANPCRRVQRGSAQALRIYLGSLKHYLICPLKPLGQPPPATSPATRELLAPTAAPLGFAAGVDLSAAWYAMGGELFWSDTGARARGAQRAAALWATLQAQSPHWGWRFLRAACALDLTTVAKQVAAASTRDGAAGVKQTTAVAPGDVEAPGTALSACSESETDVDDAALLLALHRLNLRVDAVILADPNSAATQRCMAWQRAHRILRLTTDTDAAQRPDTVAACWHSIAGIALAALRTAEEAAVLAQLLDALRTDAVPAWAQAALPALWAHGKMLGPDAAPLLAALQPHINKFAALSATARRPTLLAAHKICLTQQQVDMSWFMAQAFGRAAADVLPEAAAAWVMGIDARTLGSCSTLLHALLSTLAADAAVTGSLRVGTQALHTLCTTERGWRTVGRFLAHQDGDVLQLRGPWLATRAPWVSRAALALGNALGRHHPLLLDCAAMALQVDSVGRDDSDCDPEHHLAALTRLWPCLRRARNRPAKRAAVDAVIVAALLRLQPAARAAAQATREPSDSAIPAWVRRPDPEMVIQWAACSDSAGAEVRAEVHRICGNVMTAAGALQPALTLFYVAARMQTEIADAASALPLMAALGRWIDGLQKLSMAEFVPMGDTLLALWTLPQPKDEAACRIWVPMKVAIMQTCMAVGQWQLSLALLRDLARHSLLSCGRLMLLGWDHLPSDEHMEVFVHSLLQALEHAGDERRVLALWVTGRAARLLAEAQFNFADNRCEDGVQRLRQALTLCVARDQAIPLVGAEALFVALRRTVQMPHAQAFLEALVASKPGEPIWLSGLPLNISGLGFLHVAWIMGASDSVAARLHAEAWMAKVGMHFAQDAGIPGDPQSARHAALATTLTHLAPALCHREGQSVPHVNARFKWIVRALQDSPAAVGLYAVLSRQMLDVLPSANQQMGLILLAELHHATTHSDVARRHTLCDLVHGVARQVLEPYDVDLAVSLERLVLQTVLALPDADHGAWARITSGFIAMVGAPAASLAPYRDALEKKASLPPEAPRRNAVSPVVVEQIISFPAVLTQIGDGARMQTLYGLLRILPQYDEILTALTSEREATKDLLAIVMGNQELRRTYFHHLELGAPDGQPLIMSADMLLLVHEATRLHGPLLPAELTVLLLCYMTTRQTTKAPQRWDALRDAVMAAAEEDLWGLETEKLDTLQPHLRPFLRARSPRIRWAHILNQRLNVLRTRFANGPQAYHATARRITGAEP